jgi:DNA-binding transcriptional MerR regulator
VNEAASFHPEVRFRVKRFLTKDFSMLIGELAAASGLSREALRFYEQQGLIRARRLGNGYRDYPAEAVALVQYIRTAQQLGFTLAEIGDRLPGIWDAPEPGPALAQVLAMKLLEIDTRIAALQTLRQTLAERVAADCPLQPQENI